MAKSKKPISKVASEIGKISSKLGLVHPSQLTRSQFLKHAKDFNEWDLRGNGGLSRIVKTYFPVEDNDHKLLQAQKLHIKQFNKLERTVAELDLFRDSLVREVSGIVASTKIDVVKMNDKETKKYFKSVSKPSKHEVGGRSVCALWTDHHFGMTVDKDEVGGINEYNWTIAARRLGMLCEELAVYKEERRGQHEELVIFLSGDNIAGVIHDQESPDIDPVTHQVNGAFYYYVQALRYLSNFYPKIRVEVQAGNHGRMMHKVSKDRALHNKFDSYEHILAFALSGAFANDPKITFNIPKSPFCDTMVQGHRIYSTHGDTVFYVGNPGKAIPLANIENQVNRINDSTKGNKYELFCVGHVHHPLSTHVTSGPKLLINGCLVGTDPFAHSIGIHSSFPVQIVWEVTKKYVQGDTRNIYVSEADGEKKYEKIIKPYNRELVLNL